MKTSIITLLLLHFVLFSFSQNFGYEVMGTYQRPITKAKLHQAKAIIDINPGYPSSWISSYVTVDISATCNGKITKAASPNDTLSNEQLGILKMADLGTDIVVDVKYFPENTPKDNGVKTINFSFTVIPEIEAEYIGGYPMLKQYLKENAIDKISESLVNQIQGVTISFNIDEQGQVSESQITKASEFQEIDKLLLQTINDMPTWKPAEDSNGRKVKQQFVLSVGNMIGC